MIKFTLIAVVAMGLAGCGRQQPAAVAASVPSYASTNYDRMTDRTDAAANLVMDVNGAEGVVVVGTWVSGSPTTPFPRRREQTHVILGSSEIGSGPLVVLATFSDGTETRFILAEEVRGWTADFEQVGAMAYAASVEWRTRDASGRFPPHAIAALRDYIEMFE